MSEAASEQVQRALQHVDFLNDQMRQDALAACIVEEHQVFMAGAGDSLMGVVASRNGLPSQVSVGTSNGVDILTRNSQDAFNTPSATYSLSGAETRGVRFGLYKWPAQLRDIHGEPHRASEWIREPFRARSDVNEGTLVHGLPLVGTLRFVRSLMRDIKNEGPLNREYAMPLRIMTIFQGSLTLMGEVKRPDGR